MSENIYDRSVTDLYYQTVGKNINLTSEPDKKLVSFIPRDLKGKRVLDLGCGNGRYGELFSGLGVEKIIGIDSSETMVEEAKKRAIPGFQVFCKDMLDIEDIPLKFDIIFSRFSVMYCQDIRKLMQ